MPKLYFDSRRYADLPLHYGKVPPWLAERMRSLGGAIVESIVLEYGKSAVLSRLSDPFWFQAFGCVLGMDWHSSGITTSVMGALKGAVNYRSHELGIYIAGGKGKHSRNTPEELKRFSDKTGLDGNELVRSSRLTAKVDNNAIQDGFQIYMHNFVVTDEGEWTVIQQGMDDSSGMARRYHWHSETVKSFIETPHTFIYGKNQGEILNLTDKEAGTAKSGILELVTEKPSVIIPEVRRLILPAHHELKAEDVNLKRLGSVLALAHDTGLRDFESLLLLEGVGPRTVQSLALVSEIIHGTPARFSDPGRFSFAHGGKDGHPFPVPTTIYDETIQLLQTAVEKAKIGQPDKNRAIQNLHLVAQLVEQQFVPDEALFEKALAKERAESHHYGGRTVFGKARPPANNGQLSLFD
ncbi:DUF763 domain-containing protein [Fluviicola chungangensis]|uniref:DUF763 domain-containing protein n=1 Tax=Fluviicola chungangensis TaxID=2597671 RepID=A0A556MQ38_9FLAO|nr:DUF763 domain-containing protein [Fluviicola chungangensis]TSJ42067.1 DUF763 domain-containing protein [Fluviicola chungangensis]